VTKLAPLARPAGRFDLLVSTGLADRVLPELRRCRWNATSIIATRSIRTADRLDQAIGGDAAGQRQIWSSGWPRCCTTSASRATGVSRRAASPSTPPRSGRGQARGAGRFFLGLGSLPLPFGVRSVTALRFSAERSRTWPRVELHPPALPRLQRGLGRREWTDSRAAAYVRDAGDQLGGCTS